MSTSVCDESLISVSVCAPRECSTMNIGSVSMSSVSSKPNVLDPISSKKDLHILSDLNHLIQIMMGIEDFSTDCSSY